MIEINKSLIILISSSKKEEQFWKNLLPNLRSSPSLSKNYDIQLLPIYSMLSSNDGQSFLYRLLQQRQRQKETLARVLQKPPFLNDNPDQDPELTLAGLGSGCYLIQEFLLRCLNKDGNVRQLRNIRQVIFLKPPRFNLFALTLCLFFALALISVLLYFLWPSGGIAPAIGILFAIVVAILGIVTSPQQMALLGMDSQLFLEANVQKEFEKRIKHGSRRILETWPISYQELWPYKGMRLDPKFIQEISEMIAVPNAHPNVYEVKLFEYSLAVSPLLPKDLPLEARRKLNLRESKEKYTSQAIYTSHVHFAGNDQTGNEELRKTYGEIVPWELRQRTRAFLEVQDPATDNLAPPEENFAKNSVYIYRFTPKPHGNHFLRAIIYGGYDINNRDLHIHLRADTNYSLIRGTLDLRIVCQELCKSSGSG